MSVEKPVDPLAACHGLFVGELKDETFFPFPEQEPEEKEKADLTVEAFREWAKDNLDPVQIDREQEIPQAVREALADMGLLGMTVPEEYGGYGFSTTSYCRVMEEVTRADASLPVYLGAHLSIGAKPLLMFGNEEQKQRYLPRVATGELLCAFALTEPGAGSDAGSLRTRADWDEERKAYRLNGNKIWISNGGYAGLFSVFARTSGGPAGGEGIAAFLVERGAPGFTNGPSEHKMGIRGTSTTELAFQDVLVAPENMLGKPGEGFNMATASLETGRLSLGAGCTGAAKELVRLAARHAKEREQFKKSILDFGMIREKLGRMVSHAYASESMVYLTAGLVDRGAFDTSVEAGYCKVFGSEMLWQAVNDAVQIAGGIGYMTEYPYERHLRDARINLIFEGTNEILRLASTLEGLKEPGRRATEALRAAKAAAGAEVLDAALRAAGGSRPVAVPSWVPPELQAQGEALTATLQLFSERVMAVMKRYRRAILGQEYTIRRVADAAMRVYAMAACLSRASSRIAQRGAEAAARDILLTSRWIEEARLLVARELDDLDTPRDRYDDDLAELLRADGRYPVQLF